MSRNILITTSIAIFLQLLEMIHTASHNNHVILIVSLYITYKFYARNSSMLTLVGFNDDQLDVMIKSQ